ncbi:MAG: hypothetical protein V4501_02030 [Pseudomonadota bacterium]
MFCRLSLFTKRVNKPTNWPMFTPHSPLHYKVVSELGSGPFIAELKSDRFDYERPVVYSNRSWNELTYKLQNDTFYIFVDKGVLGKSLKAGHIASFYTDDKGKIVKDSCISLRTGARTVKVLKGFFSHELTQPPRTNSVWKTDVIDDVEIEFRKYNFLNSAPNIPLEKQKPKFLIGLPISLNERLKLATYIQEAKLELTGQDYILFNGEVDGQDVDALNCITAFYRALNLKGSEPNPSPQMAAWSYLGFLLGSVECDWLIKPTKLKEHGIERTHNDILRIRK